MTYSYDVTRPIGRVRLLLNDVGEPWVFSDAEIAAFLEMARGANPKRAAALAIDANASNEVLASKVLRSQDLATDGAKAADALRKHAALLRTEAGEDDAASDEGSYFGLVDMVGPTTYPELTERPSRWWL
ncbi:MAG TPA: hypothetical protein VGE38_07140 [Nocardioides sp.]|uniref:hypothetical protein n=1 Tax=Nocardioides sp. TaxID=35761 RepID=UPI002ED89B9B